jgi:hypothetical protein
MKVALTVFYSSDKLETKNLFDIFNNKKKINPLKLSPKNPKKGKKITENP